MSNRLFLKTSDLPADLMELWRITVNLRHWTAKYDENLGADNRRRKQFWEKKADDFIKSKGVLESEPGNTCGVLAGSKGRSL
jgi:hypothetical protein